MKRPSSFLALLLAATVTAADGLGPETLLRLDRALAAVNLAIADLGWDKRPIADDFRLAVVNQTLDRPLDLAARVDQAEAEFAGDPLASAQAAAVWLDLTLPPEAETAAHADSGQLPGAPAAARPLLAILLTAHREALRLHAEALRALTPEERRLLAASGARLYTDESEDDWDMAPVLAAAKQIDLRALASAEVVLARAAERVRAAAATDLRPAAWKPRSWTIDGVTVALGGPGPDRHAEDVVLDPGGDDVYDAGTVIADLAGSDTYRERAGQALLATALLVDLAGDDAYLGADFVQGGTAFGASLLLDVAGDDRYVASQCAQGSAFFGVAMLFDLEGQDDYRGARFVQGFGGTRGLGALVDLAGNDVYYAGGKYPHAPLLPENYQSLSQGFGFGLRGASASGGIGILADHAGNDLYAAEVFAQGASYWFALGVLADSAGHDKYNLYQYGQGAGIHLSAGVLLDRAGNDGYTCNNGVAQGSGHDWGTGLLWDRAGNDAYQGSGMSQGGANANAVGILIDEAGNDSYAGWNEKNQGDSFFSRATIGLGVLLDGAGQDRYTHGGRDGALWTRGTVGVGYDVEPERVAQPEKKP